MTLIRTVAYITKGQREALERMAEVEECSASHILSKALLLYLQAQSKER